MLAIIGNANRGRIMREGGRNVELIDKAVLLNRIATEVHYDSEHSLEMYAKMLSLINDAPDGVVRCKDCKWWNTTKSEKCVAYDAFRFADSDDYCSWGERR